MSLKMSWQAARVQRQHDISCRQAAVQQILAEFQRTRQEMALEQQQDLTGFRAALTHQEAQRQAALQPFRAALQTYCQTVQVEVQEFLAQSRDRRQAQAQALATELATFVRQVRQETQALLAEAGADRGLLAQQLSQELRQFHTELQVSVRSLRAMLQTETLERQATVQDFLNDCTEWRIQTATATRDRLQASRLHRTTAINALFEQFATAKRDRQHHRANLRTAVWGNTTPTAPAAPPSSMRAIPTTTLPAHAPVRPQMATAPSKPASPKLAHPKLTTKPTATKPSRSAAPAKSLGKAMSTGKSTQNLAASQAANTSEVAHEKAVYHFLQNNNGGRLTQIETSLGINRFQAVDALRSLIKKGLVTQRDRVYLIQPVLATV